ncbi:MAG: RsmE family RNA methyltransferase [Polyangiales bacterium]
MTTRRIYVAKLPQSGGFVELTGPPARHVHVLRMRPGDSLILFDGDGREAVGCLESIEPAKVLCRVEAAHEPTRRHTHLVLLLAIPKGSKIDDCVRMATELGVDEIALIRTARTVPTWPEGRVPAKLDRLERIAQEAAAQCERGNVPIIHPPEAYLHWVGRLPADAHGIVFGARASRRMGTLEATSRHCWCAIGPEGGFTEDEIAAFRSGGFAVASLGRLVLRVETAVPAALSLVADRMDAFGQAR